MDELQEVVNILKGDMSLVGPRPLLVEYLPYYSKTERCRHELRPGLTGLAQTNGRNSLDWTDRFGFDGICETSKFYIRHQDNAEDDKKSNVEGWDSGEYSKSGIEFCSRKKGGKRWWQRN